ncbi:hypothetical protein AA15669_1598 [Saccharibacter floricola DSM 15669]|uniref:Uncharacterized protein n=1 Tax=Saccharibacter floricola DSM 15669 TaxID=1123227 RepID=A0ABQ0P0K0_9PROT|nr:hypothetical protein AA15669_1598 [Saccharibacter floricola DSM 15669]
MGAGGVGAGISASGQMQKQNGHSASATAVDTTVNGSQNVTINAPGTTDINGGGITAKRIDVHTGTLAITSPQNTSDYESKATQASASGEVGTTVQEYNASGSYNQQTLKDHFVTTERKLSGLYAGSDGLGVDVSGDTTLKAGVISSTADASKNSLTTKHLDAQSEDNSSVWKIESVGGQGGVGSGMLSSASNSVLTAVKSMAANSLGMLGGGRSHNEHSTSYSAIGGNITVHATSQSGSYLTDVTKANGALENKFDPQKLQNEVQASQVGSQLVGSAIGKVSDVLKDQHVWGFKDGGYLRTALEAGGNAGIAAATGGNAGAAAASTVLGNIAASQTRQLVGDLAGSLTDNPALRTSLTNALSNIIASGAGAAGGLAFGTDHSTGINALSGAAAASAIQQYNQANEDQAEKEREKIGKDILEADPEVKKLLLTSPTAKAEIEGLEKQGWSIVYGEGGEGYTDYNTKKIILNYADAQYGTGGVASTISHELGHAIHRTEYDYSSKDAFVSKTLDGEGWATLNNIIISREVNSKLSDPYNRMKVETSIKENSVVYDSIFREKGNTYDAAHEIGKYYMGHEFNSVDKKKYGDYYGDAYDAYRKGK